MTEELENKQEGLSADNGQSGREGYTPAGSSNYRSGEKPMRQRVRIQRAYAPARNYSSNNDEGGFRPEGFGAGLQSDAPQHSYRPRTSYGQQGGYQRGGYNQQRQGGYRPRYNNDNNGEGDYSQQREGGYQPRSSQYGQRPNTGYRPRYNNNADGC